MQYNTSQGKLLLPEYGRNVQRMVDHALSVEDREERNRVAFAIVQVMGQLNPHLRDYNDFKHKLWDHLFIISDFKLDVDSPYPIPSRESLKSNPERLQYPSGNIKYRPYGKIMQNIIRKATELEEGEAKQALTEMIANHLKKSYLTWNRDSVNDEVIFQHLTELSGGSLKLDSQYRLSSTRDILAKNNSGKKQNDNNNNRNNKKKKKRF